MFRVQSRQRAGDSSRWLDELESLLYCCLPQIDVHLCANGTMATARVRYEGNRMICSHNAADLTSCHNSCWRHKVSIHAHRAWKRLPPTGSRMGWGGTSSTCMNNACAFGPSILMKPRQNCRAGHLAPNRWKAPLAADHLRTGQAVILVDTCRQMVIPCVLSCVIVVRTIRCFTIHSTDGEYSKP